MDSSLSFLWYAERGRDLDDVEALFIYLYRIKKELQGALTLIRLLAGRAGDSVQHLADKRRGFRGARASKRD